MGTREDLLESARRARYPATRAALWRAVGELAEEQTVFTKELYTVTYQRASDGETVTMQVDAYNDEYAVPIAVKQAQENEGTYAVPRLTFVGKPVSQAVFDQFAATQAMSGGPAAPHGVGSIADAIGVYRNKETGKLEVWIDQMTVFGGGFPDTDQGQVDAALRADEMRAGRV